MQRLALLGAGKIGESLLAGLVSSGWTDVVATGRRQERLDELRERYGIETTLSNAEAIDGAKIVVVAVKPQDIEPLLTELKPVLRAGTLIVSLCAGLPTSLYERRLPEGTPVVRVMPNTPMVVGEAMSAVSGGSNATPEHLKVVEELLSTVGKVAVVPESQQDAVTALSGSGPAYFFFLVEAMIDAGILLGIPRDLASQLIIQSAVGAATMLAEGSSHPVILREAVTSPAGTTIMAIRELEKHGVRAALLAAIESARDRSIELGRQHED